MQDWDAEVNDLTALQRSYRPHLASEQSLHPQLGRAESHEPYTNRALSPLPFPQQPCSQHIKMCRVPAFPGPSHPQAVCGEGQPHGEDQQPFEGGEKDTSILTAKAASPGALVVRITQEAAICKEEHRARVAHGEGVKGKCSHQRPCHHGHTPGLRLLGGLPGTFTSLGGMTKQD